MGALQIIRETLSWHYLAKSGEALWRGICEQIDDVHAAGRAALKARLPRVAPPDALIHIGEAYNLDWPARLSDEEIRTYLQDPWDIWDNAGSYDRLVAEIKRLGYSNVGVVTYRDLVNAGLPPDTTFGGFASFFYVILFKPNPWLQGGKWGDGSKWGQAPYTWGSTAKPEEINEIRRVIAKWKPAGSSCRYIQAQLSVMPLRYVTWPVREHWETRGFYNVSYDRE